MVTLGNMDLFNLCIYPSANVVKLLCITCGGEKTFEDEDLKPSTWSTALVGLVCQAQQRPNGNAFWIL